MDMGYSNTLQLPDVMPELPGPEEAEPSEGEPITGAPGTGKAWHHLLLLLSLL